MRRWIGVALATVLVLVASTATSAAALSAPNPSLTPGAIDARVTQATIQQTICVDGYTKTVRKVTTATKNKVYAEYHVTRSNRSKYVIDHLVPLEVGGSNVIANLWPQPKKDATRKDRVEETLRAAVCSGAVDLATAQRAFETDWRDATTAATTTTSSTTTTTTRPPVTQAPTTQAPATEPPATQAPAQAAQQGVTPGAYCAPVGATGYTVAGTQMICSTTNAAGVPYSDGRARWHAA